MRLLKGVLALTCLLGLAPGAASADIVFGGVGITIMQAKEKRIQIIDVIKTGPADQAGIVAGEYLSHVDGAVVKGMDTGDIAARVRGPVGSEVNLTIEDEAATRSRDLKVTRQKIVVKCAIEGYYQLDLLGSWNNGTLSGRIGSSWVRWNVFNGSIFEYLNGKRISLRYADWGGNQQINGWVGGTYVTWNGWNNSFSGHVGCIP